MQCPSHRTAEYTMPPRSTACDNRRSSSQSFSDVAAPSSASPAISRRAAPSVGVTSLAAPSPDRLRPSVSATGRSRVRPYPSVKPALCSFLHFTRATPCAAASPDVVLHLHFFRFRCRASPRVLCGLHGLLRFSVRADAT